MRGKIIALVLVLLVFEALIILAMYYFMNSGKCDYNNPSKTYIKHESPCVINFLCIQNETPFSDECGCGCRVS